MIDCQNFTLERSDVKIILFDTISALSYLHKNNLMHRDVKTPNIMVNDQGQVALTDYDLIWNIPDPQINLTKNMVTWWYRAPEILYGSSFYSEKIDIWAFGCVMAELINEAPLFPGENEID